MLHERTVVVTVLLGAAFALTAALTWQAVEAARSHRLAAQRSVEDFAAIAADELLRRAGGELEGYGFMQIRAAAYPQLGQSWVLPSTEALGDERFQQAAPLVRQMFLVDTRARRVDPPGLDPALERWLLDEMLPTVLAREHPGEQVVRVRIGENEHLIGYGLRWADEGRLFGFLVNEDAFGPFLEGAFARRSVFPPSVGGGRLTSADLFVEIRRGDRVVFRSPGSFDDEFGLERRLGPEYGELFRGTAVRSSIDARAAPMLVSGGVPRSRVPMLVLVLAINAGLLAAAAFLLRREGQLARLRADFISGVSHELRTPLTQIRMFAETLLLRRIRSDEEERRSLEIIDQESRRLAHLVDNVLTFSRGERGVLELAMHDHDAATLLRETIELFAPIARSRRVTIATDLNGPIPVRVDGDAFRQVLLNFLENAVKYGPAGQTVTVRARVQEGMFRVEVDDQGPGIPESEREAVWRKFVRLERDRGTHRAGTGIGLAVAREIVSRHGGRTWMQSAPGGGARFIVEVPA